MGVCRWDVARAMTSEGVREGANCAFVIDLGQSRRSSGVACCLRQALSPRDSHGSSVSQRQRRIAVTSIPIS